MLTRLPSEQYTSICEHSKCIYGSPKLFSLVRERDIFFFVCFSSKGSTEAKARTVSKKDLKTPGRQTDTVLSL